MIGGRTRGAWRPLAVAAVAASTCVMTLAAAPARADEPVQVTPRGLAATRDGMVGSVDREFRNVWSTPVHGWTGDVGACQPGVLRQGFRDEIRSRTNWYRTMVGLDPVAEDPGMTRHAQAAALMMAAASRLSHGPDPSWPCHSDDGTQGARTSNLTLGRYGPASVDGLMVDAGDNNRDVGHRRWILDPSATAFGFGSVPPSDSHPAAAAMAVIPPTYRERHVAQHVVAWPPAGHVPAQLVPRRWSLSVFDDETLADVRVQVSVNGRSVSAPIEVVSTGGYGGGPAVVFLPDLSALEAPGDDRFDVVVAAGARSWRYQVDTVDMSPPPARAFATKLIEDFLQAEPTFERVEALAHDIEPWTSRQQVVHELTLSDAWAGAVIDGFYLDTLGRRADAGGRAYWISRLRAGVPVAAVAAGFYGSDEYVATHGPGFGPWIDELYSVLLGRVADDSGRAFWTDRAASTSPAAVAYDFYQSVESRRTRVTELYHTLLDRGPDRAGLAFWSGQLSNGDDLALAKELAASDEYFTTP